MIIGMLGLGFVGQGIIQILSQNRTKLESALGETITVKSIAVRDTQKKRNIPANITLTSDSQSVIIDSEIDTIIDVISGDSYDYIKQALASGKHVVSANKSVIATHQAELLALADANQVKLSYDASVGGSIPIIQNLLHGFVANEIQSITGILNGTTNYMLTRMQQDKLSYNLALKDAQEKGFAEADPYMDVSGTDVAHKLIILAGIAFNADVSIDSMRITGIDQLELDDIQYASQLGYTIKLIGYIKQSESGLIISVAPMLVPHDHHMSTINNELNAVVITGDCVGDAILVGKGAGGVPTASAILSDIIGLKKSNPNTILKKTCISDYNAKSNYLRIEIPDNPGNLEKLTHAITQSGISIKTLIQNSTRSDENTVDVLVITHPSEQGCSQTDLVQYLPGEFRVISVLGVLG